MTMYANLVRAARWTAGVVFLTCSAASYGVEIAPFDFDADGHVDLWDARQFFACVSGPDVPAGGAECPTVIAYSANRDGDIDVDLLDFAQFQICFSSDGPARFDCAAPLAPLPFVQAAAGLEDMPLLLALSAFDPHSDPPAVTFTVTALPGQGQLSQSDGTPIVTVPTPVTDPAGGLRFLTEADEFGLGYATLGYTATSLVTGLTSVGGAVSIDIAPINDAPVILVTPFATTEDTPATFQLTAADPDPGDVVTFLVVEAPVLGSLYQVDSNGVPLLNELITDGTFVSHPQGLVHYVPHANAFGTDSVRVRAFDLAGAGSFQPPVPIHVEPVNDAPISQDGIVEWPNSAGAIIRNIQPVADDVEPPINTLQICIISLPAVGELRTQVGGEPIVQAPFCTIERTFEYLYPNPEALGFGCITPPANLPSAFPLDAASMVYQSFDGELYSPPATIDLQFVYDNTTPYVTSPLAHTTGEDTMLPFTLSGEDIDGDLTVFKLLGPPRHGVLLRDGRLFSYPALCFNQTSLTYVPAENFETLNSPEDFINVEILDAHGTRDCTYVFTFEVTAANDAPTLTGPSSIYTDGFSGGVFGGFNVTDDAAAGSLLTVDLRALGQAALSIQLFNPAGLVSFQQISPTHVHGVGTLPAINTALNSGVIFYVNQNGSTEGSVEIVVDDQGNTGAGIPNPLTGTLLIPVEIPPPEP